MVLFHHRCSVGREREIRSPLFLSDGCFLDQDEHAIAAQPPLVAAHACSLPQGKFCVDEHAENSGQVRQGSNTVFVLPLQYSVRRDSWFYLFLITIPSARIILVKVNNGGELCLKIRS